MLRDRASGRQPPLQARIQTGYEDIVASAGALPAQRERVSSPGGGPTPQAPVQREAVGSAPERDIHEAAQRGVAEGGARLPYLDLIQRSFGAHDVSNIESHTGATAARANSALGARAYATGNHVAFAGTPDLHTAAHEAAHVVQQRAGVHLEGGVGEAGDAYEQSADAIADRVVRGESAVDLLPSASSGGGAAVQRRDASGPQAPGGTQRGAAELLEEAIEVIETALAVATGYVDESPGARSAAEGASSTAPGAGATGPASTTARRASPDTVAHLQVALTGLIRLRGAAEAEIRRAVTPILTHIEAPGVGGGAEAAGPAPVPAPPVQRSTLVVAAPLLGAGPPGWVAYAVLGVATVGIMGYAAYQAARTRAKERERAEPRVVPRTDEPPQQHRGRIQVQGGGLELSFPWSRPTPMTKVEALAGLAQLRGMLGRRELSERDEAFAQAAVFITTTLHTCPPDISRTFQNRAVRQRRGDERVDIEIRTGVAFA